MKPKRLRYCKSLIVLGLFVSAAQLMPRSALSMTAANLSDQVRRVPRSELQLAQLRQCSQRVGPPLPHKPRPGKDGEKPEAEDTP
jgi:hypothetical protein